jgi:hypothetical protein
MMTLAALISTAVVLLSLVDWRRGLLAVIVIGVLQDAFRKLTPGVPSTYIVWSMALYLTGAAVAIVSRGLPPVRTIFLHDGRVRAAWIVFVLMISLQLVNALIRWASPVVPIFGALFYLGPPLAMLIACGYATGEKRLRRYLGFYALVLAPTCLTVYLSPTLQESWPVLRDVGTFIGQELVIYDVGTALKSYSGILRTGEISAWHAATAAIFLTTLSITARRQPRWLLTALLIALMIGVIVLTGRRKMLMTLSIFFIVQWALLAWFRKGMGKIAVMIILVGTLSSFSFTLLEPTSESSLYVERSTTVFGDASERMVLAFNLMKSAFNRSAGLGLGAGSAAQGGRYAGIDQSRAVGGSSESGLGFLMVELGLLGVLVVLWLLFAISRSIFGNLRKMAAMSDRLLLYQVSLLSFLFANLMTFTVATQIYGDYFVLLILGTVAGFVVRINNLAIRHVAAPPAPRLEMGKPRNVSPARQVEDTPRRL